MADLKIYKETTVPGSLEPNAIYLIGPGGAPSDLEIYVVNSAGNATRKALARSDVSGMISSALSGMGQGTAVLADIAASELSTGRKNKKCSLVH